ncbi:toluene tolerance protein [Stutzerimonas kirkiae]|uniref:Toluene tolerance protein n=1 Tax=Stutzerimonas kirkiae TaxID=2211392 RepID=A0A4Q9R6W9_9GAMM|nr:toluene tolerance protein [Stutzerimonas kirkiae]TBU95744.1 toluene tolerance protein [Stutzerimonas kirkiae]TBV02735.1 toluene tolerance protein [Stutzerimonas kirkiae]TBV12262.1 toluene tolerance protein [Stutzerimonas kirkiae]
MSSITDQQFSALRQNAEVIEADHNGEKVLALADGSYLKLFRRKRFLSSAALFSYEKRFAQNARELENRGIPCPRIIGTYAIKSIERTAVHYWPLPGRTLRQYLANANNDHRGLNQLLGAFIASLHQQGVYFRSLHLGNVIITETGELGLIDISDMSCTSGPLRRNKRVRNFQHLFRYRQDIQSLSEHKASFIGGYIERLPVKEKSYYSAYFETMFGQHEQPAR